VLFQGKFVRMLTYSNRTINWKWRRLYCNSRCK